jgi:hypothetical protein
VVTTALDSAQTDHGAARTASGPGWRHAVARLRPDLLAIGFYVALGVYVCANYWADINHRVSSHLPTDHSWFEWLMAHGAYSVRHLENPLFSMRQNVPLGVNMMANTSVLGITLPMAPITMLIGPQASYSIYLGGALAATATTAYWVFSRHLVASRAAAFVAALFVGFAPSFIHHANGQPNFATHFMLPLIVLWVIRLGRTGRWLRDGVVLGLMVAYQVFINEEMLLMTALACGLAVGIYAAQRRPEARRRLPGFLRGLGVTAVVAGLLTAYPIWFQFRGPQSYRGLQGGIFHSWGEDLTAYVTFPRDSLAGVPAVEHTLGRTEQNTWFGWPLVVLVLVIAVLLWRRSILARTVSIVALVFAVGAIGPEVHVNAKGTGIPGPWALVPNSLPLVEMMMPTRLTLVVVGVIGILLALAWQKTTDLARADTGTSALWTIKLCAYGAIGAALIPLFPRPLPAVDYASPPRFITSGQWRPYVPAGRSLLPVPVPSNVDGLATLRWSAVTQQEFPIPSGYFIGPNEHGHGYFGGSNRPTARLINRVARTGQVPLVTPQMRGDTMADLKFWRVSVVVVGDHPHRAALEDLMQRLLSADGRRVADVRLWDVPAR